MDKKRIKHITVISWNSNIGSTMNHFEPDFLDIHKLEDLFLTCVFKANLRQSFNWIVWSKYNLLASLNS